MRFKINKINGCWEWQGHLDGDGYGAVKINQVSYKAHRISFLLLKGLLRNKKEIVCHTCDNPKCINPNHLFLGTSKDNAQDRERKGRGVLPDVKGEKHPKSRLTNLDVKFIRHCELPVARISKIFKLKNSYVTQILNKERWKHIE